MRLPCCVKEMLSGSEVALELSNAFTASVLAGAGDLAQQAAKSLSFEYGILAPYETFLAAARAPRAKQSSSAVYTEAPLLTAALALESLAAVTKGAHVIQHPRQEEHAPILAGRAV